MPDQTTQKIAAVFLRIALAVAFLSAVADRVGLWGAAGSPGVAWGDWQAFLDYTHVLNPFVPLSLIPTLGFVATALEVILAIALLIGFKLRYVAFASGFLLLLFAVCMTFTLGIKPPLDYSVFTAAGSAFLLATISTPSVKQTTTK